MAAETQTRKRRWWLWIIGGLLLIASVAAGGFVLWASTPSGTLLPEVDAALQSDDAVRVVTENWLAFIPTGPTGETPTTGLVLYPGGRVLAEAYAPLARRIAEEGYLAVIVYAPLNLAILDSGAANAVIEHYADVEHWVVGGHSLGGATAAIFAADNPGAVDGLAMMASFPADGRLAERDELRVVSIYATNDGLAQPDEIRASADELPPDTRFVEITGGNHAQFGYYGPQNGDGEATIPRETQIQQTTGAILELLAEISG